MSTETKKRGRPKGSKTTQKPSVNQSKAHCPNCHSTSYEVVRKLHEQEHAGVTYEGERYTSIVRRVVKCSHCPQSFIVIERTYNPKKWE